MLTQTEAWAARRILARMPVDFDQIHIRDEIYFILTGMYDVPLKERSAYIEHRLPNDLESILRIDPNTEPPAPDERSNERWKILHVSELSRLPKARYLIEPFIIERGLTVLFGPSGAYKSFAALDFALQAAQTRPVMYVVYEGLLGYSQRVQAWCQHHQLSAGQMFFVIGTLAVMETQELDKFILACKDMQPGLIVLDTVARAMTGSDENSTRDMGMFVAACEQLQSSLACSVMVVHHTSKAGIQERGSGALRGAADIMIKQTADDDMIIVECEKSKDAEPFDTLYKQPLPVVFEMAGESMSVPVLVDASVMIPNKDKLTKNQLKVLEALAMDIFQEGATSGELADTLPEINRTSLIRVLNRMMQLGLVSQATKRDPYTITEDGLSRLSRLSHLFKEEEEVSNVDEQPKQPKQPRHQPLPEGVKNG